MSTRYAKIGLGKVPVPEGAEGANRVPDGLVDVPLPIVTLASPNWEGQSTQIGLAEADKETEVGFKLEFANLREIEMTLSWVPVPTRKDGAVLGAAFGGPAQVLQGKHIPVLSVTLNPDTSPAAVEEMRGVLECARDYPYAAMDLLDTESGRIIRVLWQKVRQVLDKRSFYYVRRQTVRVNQVS